MIPESEIVISDEAIDTFLINTSTIRYTIDAEYYVYQGFLKAPGRTRYGFKDFGSLRILI